MLELELVEPSLYLAYGDGAADRLAAAVGAASRLRFGVTVVDTLGRPVRDLRISVTDRCNFRCVYCMPKEVFGRDYRFLDAARAPHASRRSSGSRARSSRRASRRSGSPAASRSSGATSSAWSRCWRAIDGLDLTLTTNGSLLAQKARGAARRRPRPRHRQPRLARRRGLPRDERRRLPGRARARGHRRGGRGRA